MIGLMRVKNEARWIERAIRSIRPICDRLLVMDDHSDDGTPELAYECGATVLDSPFSGLQEVRDKNWLLGQANPEPGEWALMIDGDEELIDQPEILRAIEAPAARAYRLRILYLWNQENSVRVDGVYSRFTRPSLFRFQPGLSFGGTQAGSGFHCSNVPNALWPACRPCGARLLHYGYLHAEDRIRKYRWYSERDGGNRSEGGYKHMVVGDLFPADARFMHGGPLKLEALNA